MANGRLLVSSPGGRAKGACWGLFYMETNLTHDLITSQRPHLQIPSPWVLGYRHMDLRGHNHSDHSVPCFSQMPPMLTETWTLTRNPVNSLSSKHIVPNNWKSVGKKSSSDWLSPGIWFYFSVDVLTHSSGCVDVTLSQWLQQFWVSAINRDSIWGDISDPYLWYISSYWRNHDWFMYSLQNRLWWPEECHPQGRSLVPKSLPGKDGHDYQHHI